MKRKKIYLFSVRSSEPFVYFGKDKIILNQAKKDKNIVYGAQSVKKQIGMFARPTQDYDIYSNNPRASAHKLQKTLDKHSGGDYYFSRPAMHPGTFKVKYVGVDRKKDTQDDIEIADFTKPNRKIAYTNIQGVNYSALKETLKDKFKSLKDKKYAFRHEKDRQDVNRIQTYQRYRRI